jgi:hypothetical protein
VDLNYCFGAGVVFGEGVAAGAGTVVGSLAGCCEPAGPLVVDEVVAGRSLLAVVVVRSPVFIKNNPPIIRIAARTARGIPHPKPPSFIPTRRLLSLSRMVIPESPSESFVAGQRGAVQLVAMELCPTLRSPLKWLLAFIHRRLLRRFLPHPLSVAQRTSDNVHGA